MTTAPEKRKKKKTEAWAGASRMKHTLHAHTRVVCIIYIYVYNYIYIQRVNTETSTETRLVDRWCSRPPFVASPLQFSLFPSPKAHSTTVTRTHALFGTHTQVVKGKGTRGFTFTSCSCRVFTKLSTTGTRWLCREQQTGAREEAGRSRAVRLTGRYQKYGLVDITCALSI